MLKNLHVAARLIAMAAVLGVAPSASAQIGKIVGLGAARCAQFTLDAERSPVMQRDYFAWAQGFMSGVLLSQPTGVDEGLDLIPQSLPLLQQLEFLRQYCRDKPDEDFTDAVLALYKKLRLNKGDPV